MWLSGLIFALMLQIFIVDSCLEDKNCQKGYLCFNNETGNGICRECQYKFIKSCTKDSDCDNTAYKCVDGFCDLWIVQNKLQMPNSPCKVDSDCMYPKICHEKYKNCREAECIYDEDCIFDTLHCINYKCVDSGYVRCGNGCTCPSGKSCRIFDGFWRCL